MAFTREFLKGLGVELTDEQVQKIMDEHGTTVNTAKTAHDSALQSVKDQLAKRADISPEKLTEVNASVADLQAKLKAFDGVDVAALQAQLSEAQTKVAEAETKLNTAETEHAAKLGTIESEHAAKVAELELDGQLREKLASLQFSSDYARTGIYNDVKGKVKLEEGKLTGFDEAITELKTAQPKAFVEEAPPQDPQPKAGGAQHGGNPPPASPGSIKEALRQKYKT